MLVTLFHSKTDIYNTCVFNFRNMFDILRNFDIYLGTVAGSIIDFKLGKHNSKTPHLRNDEKCEITSLCWGRSSGEVLIGYKKGNAKIYNFITEKSTCIPVVEKSHVVGVVPFENDVILATNKGNIFQWKNNKIQPYLTNEDDTKTLEKIIINPYNENHLGIGGVNYDIKVYDINTKKVVFQGKSDRHDELELAQPISINSIAFFDRNNWGIDIGTVTKQGQIRIYDTRKQRRPVKIYKSPDLVYTSICATNVQNEICVGSTKGYLQVMDLRNDIKPVKTFKGFMGGITDIYCDAEYPLVASCCLDRHFRVHDISKKKLIHEEYIKIQTPVMLMKHKNFVELNKRENDEGFEDDIKEEKKRKKIKTK